MLITLRRSLALAVLSGLAVSVAVGVPRGGRREEPPVATMVAAAPAKAPRPVVQIALLLDTSGSMDGLIEQAKAELWNIVNDFIMARHKGLRPEMRVALYEYGKATIPASEGHVRMILPLTDDLDAVSAELFKLKTNGGEEYCGKVIQAATEGLSWSSGASDLRFIVIAGNEPFTQGDVDYHTSVPAAVKRGIVVNTIFCGNQQEGEKTNWKDGAVLGEGTYSFIDHNAMAVQIPAPQDNEIVRLGTELNRTYVAYGVEGKDKLVRQSEQDSNAAGASAESAVQRAACKASDNYRNASWDLVDAVRDGKCKVEDVKAEELPAEMRDLKPEERKAYVEKLTKDRAEIQGKIQSLEQDRQKFVEAKRKEMAGSAAQTLSSALIAAMRQQAAVKGYTYEK